MKSSMLTLCTALALALALAACQPEADPQAAAAAQAAAVEQKAEAMAQQFESAWDQRDWGMAAAHGDILMAEYPHSAAAVRIRERHAEARAKANAEDEQRRMAALWSYQTEPAEGGEQLSAAIYAKDNVDTDGSGAGPVRLIFRDHPDWGRSAYLTLEAGDFDCYGGCDVQVSADGGEPKPMDASRPDTDQAIAMFIEDEAALWALVQDADVIAIEFPVKAGGTRTATFEVGGVKPSKLPW